MSKERYEVTPVVGVTLFWLVVLILLFAYADKIEIILGNLIRGC